MKEYTKTTKGKRGAGQVEIAVNTRIPGSNKLMKCRIAMLVATKTYKSIALLSNSLCSATRLTVLSCPVSTIFTITIQLCHLIRSLADHTK